MNIIDEILQEVQIQTAILIDIKAILMEEPVKPPVEPPPAAPVNIVVSATKYNLPE